MIMIRTNNLIVVNRARRSRMVVMASGLLPFHSVCCESLPPWFNKTSITPLETPIFAPWSRKLPQQTLSDGVCMILDEWIGANIDYCPRNVECLRLHPGWRHTSFWPSSSSCHRQLRRMRIQESHQSRCINDSVPPSPVRTDTRSSSVTGCTVVATPKSRATRTAVGGWIFASSSSESS